MQFFQCMGRGDSNTFMGGRPSTNPLKAYAKATEQHQLVGSCSVLWWWVLHKGKKCSHLGLANQRDSNQLHGRDFWGWHWSAHNTPEYLQRSHSPHCSTSEPWQVSSSTHCNKGCIKPFLMLLAHGIICLLGWEIGVWWQHTTQAVNTATRWNAQGDHTATDYRRA